MGKHELAFYCRKRRIHSQCSDDQSQHGKDDEDRVKTHTFNETLEKTIEHIEQPRRKGGFTQGNTTHGQEDDRPVERMEVLLYEWNR